MKRAGMLEHSPIIQLVRRLTGRATSDRRVIDRMGLPEVLRERCLTLTKRTRLRTRERVEVARELAAHCADAIEAGRTPEDILSTMGDPKPLARLLRRGMLRKRHPIERSVRFAIAATGWTLGGSVLLYSIHATRFYMGTPEVVVDFAGALNERSVGIPEQDLAWPLYREAHHTLDMLRREAITNVTGFDASATDEFSRDVRNAMQDPFLSPSHEHYDAAIAVYEAGANNILLYREASRRAVLGYRYGYELMHPDEPLHEMRYDTLPIAASPADQPPLINLLLAHLSPLRQAARDLAFHAMISARAGQADEVVADLVALNRLASHLSEEPFLIGHLVARAIGALADQAAMQVIQMNPELLSGQQLAKIAHATSARAQGSFTRALYGDASWFEDYLQRGFTNDGHGNGRATKHAMYILGENPLEYSETDHRSSLFSRMVLPVTGLITADRQTLQSEYDSYIDELAATIDFEPDEMIRRVRKIEQRLESATGLARISRWPLQAAVPAAGRALTSELVSRMHRQASLAMIAATAHHAQTGAWPETLEQISPVLLPSLPEDPYNPGEPLRYVLRETGPVLYSVGENGIDDNADPSHHDRERAAHDLFRRFEGPREIHAETDFIIFPARH